MPNIERTLKAKDSDVVLAIATVAADMGYLGYEPYDFQAERSPLAVYDITLYFRERKDGKT